VKVLEDAQLIRVVRTRKVRALTESTTAGSRALYRIVADDSERSTTAAFGALMLRQAGGRGRAGRGQGRRSVESSSSCMPAWP
jgi:hypothetical protein